MPIHRATTRLGALRTFATALRAATRPGSPSLAARLSSVPRLVRATFTGEYAGTSRRRLMLLFGAVVYVISPVDFIPEAFFPLIGLADDAMVVSWIAASVINETETFLGWEREVHRATGATGAAGATDPSGPSAAGSSSAAHQTVPGHVVR
jgi:uncharacterized membrane protein YkvA (DUF1232 family)